MPLDSTRSLRDPGEGSQGGFPEEVEVLDKGNFALVAAVFTNLARPGLGGFPGRIPGVG